MSGGLIQPMRAKRIATAGFGFLALARLALVLTALSASIGQAWAFGPFSSSPPRLNDIQIVGSHNSYKTPIAASVLAQIAAANPDLADALTYAHLPLENQLALGLRQLEIDVFADPNGGRFAAPLGAQIAAGQADAPIVDIAALTRPGFKVFHIQDLDYGTHCAAFLDCLNQIKAWSDANSAHVPIIVTINPKTRPIATPGSTDPLPFSPAVYDALDSEIRAVFGPERLFTPDDARGPHITLEAAILTDGWPQIETLRGQIMFILDAGADLVDLYRQGHDSLRGRAMFANFAPGNPEAATLILNDPISQKEQIKSNVEKGYLVRTRSDAGTREARANDTGRLEAAIASGAQIISTDYYPGAPDLIENDFTVTLTKHRLLACNPVRNEADCNTRRLEPRGYQRRHKPKK